MPVMGPSFSENQAEKALVEILELLKNKYYILDLPIEYSCFSIEDTEQYRDEARSLLKQAVDKIFETDCYEKF